MFAGRNGNLIWGCRHKLKNCEYDCNHYINKDSLYISDKFEPINKMMCTRINNINQAKELLKYFFQKYNIFMQKQYSNLLKIKNKKANTLGQNFKFELYKTKLLYKALDSKLDNYQIGLVKLLAFRVT